MFFDVFFVAIYGFVAILGSYQVFVYVIFVNNIADTNPFKDRVIKGIIVF